MSTTTDAHLTADDLRNLDTIDPGASTPTDRYLRYTGPAATADRYHHAIVSHAAAYAADYASALALFKAADAAGGEDTLRMARDRMFAARARYDVVLSVMTCATE